MTDTMEILCQIILTSIEVFFGFYFYTGFLHKKIKIVPFLLLGECTVWAVCFVPGGTMADFGVFALFLAVSGIFVCSTDWGTAVLFAVLAVEIMQLGFGIVKSFSSILYLHLLPLEQNTLGTVFMLAGELASLLLTGLCYGLVRRYFSRELSSLHYNAMEKQYMFLFFIPILMIFLMDEYIDSAVYSRVATETNGTDTYLNANHYHMLAMQLLGMGSLFCILLAYKKLLQSFRLATELSLLEQKEHSLTQYVEEAKSHYEKTKAFRHDIKNHISVVKSLLQKGKTKAAISYIGDMESMAEELLFPCSTNNPVVDILVGNKLGIAKSMGIDADCSLLLPYPCGLRDIDICIVLSNALDNAIHACKKIAGTEKYIRISGRIQGDFLMMEIENSYQGTGIFKKGIGLSNVKTIAEKYGGAMSIKTQENVFLLHVLFIIPQHPGDISRQMN